MADRLFGVCAYVFCPIIPLPVACPSACLVNDVREMATHYTQYNVMYTHTIRTEAY